MHNYIQLQSQLIQQELLGRGRYGEVYKISYRNKLYAGKIIYKKLLPGYPYSSTEHINEFIGNIENVSAMLFTTQEYLNIEQFYSIIQQTPHDPPMLLTELLPDNLNSYTVRMSDKLSINEQLQSCHDMAKGLQFLHNADLMHSNLHGTNILISEDGQAKVADYVCPLITSLNEKSISQHKVYVSPESIKDPQYNSKKSDIYSLGVLCLQVCTQNPPMPNENVELLEIQRWKTQLEQIPKHPLLPLILRCLNFVVARPDIDYVCSKIMKTKEIPQRTRTNPHHIEVSKHVVRC